MVASGASVCLLEVVYAVLPDVVAESGLSLFALRMALQQYLGLDVTARKSDIRHCAELCLREFASGSDKVLTPCAMPQHADRGDECRRGWGLFTQTQMCDAVGVTAIWHGTWEPLEHARDLSMRPGVDGHVGCHVMVDPAARGACMTCVGLTPTATGRTSHQAYTAVATARLLLQTCLGAAAASPVVVAGGSTVDARSASVVPLCDGVLQIMTQALSDRILSWKAEAGNVSFDPGGGLCTDLLDAVALAFRCDGRCKNTGQL